jgi:hypothetical protein
MTLAIVDIICYLDRIHSASVSFERRRRLGPCCGRNISASAKLRLPLTCSEDFMRLVDAFGMGICGRDGIQNTETYFDRLMNEGKALEWGHLWSRRPTEPFRVTVCCTG